MHPNRFLDDSTPCIDDLASRSLYQNLKGETPEYCVSLDCTTQILVTSFTECYLNPTPGRCRETEKRSFYSYSSKTMSCTRLYGCYSIRDRNVFLSESSCTKACLPNVLPISTPSPVPINKIALRKYPHTVN